MVRLSADVAEYKTRMLEAAAATRTVGTEGERLAQTRQSMQMLGTASVAMGAAVAAGVGVAVAKFAEFDQAMSFVAATGDDARESLDSLRQAALDAGASTVFSATEAANAIEEMAKAGLSAEEILGGGLAGALDLAAAGGLAVADAAGIAATALKVFNLQGSDMSHVADLLAAGAGKAMGDVTDLSAALAQGGQVAAATGLSIEETTAGLAAFASQGLLGSDAGTSFKTMLQRLTPQSVEAQEMMDRLGISAYNASGNFVGLAEFAGNLQSAMQDLTPEQRNAALSVMFGADAVRAANVIYQEGEAGIRKWITAVDDQGYAAETAATRLDNLAGDWEAFQGALDTAFITMGEGANGPLRFLVQGLTDLIDAFNNLPDWAQQVALGVGLLTAGIGLLGGAALLVIPKIIELQIAMRNLATVTGGTRAAFGRFASFLGGPWGIAMLAATASMAAFNAAIVAGVPSQAEISNALNTTEDSVDGLRAAFDRGGFETTWMGDYADQLKDLPALLDRASEAGWRWAELTFNEQGALDSLKRYGDALGELAGTNLPAATARFGDLVDAYELTDEQAEQLLREMPAFRDALLRQAEGMDINKDSAEFLAFAMGELPGSTAVAEQALAEMEAESKEAQAALDGVAAALDGVAGSAMALGEAKDAALGAINAMSDAASDEEASIDGANDASIRLRDSLREVETAHRDSAEAILTNGGTLEEARGEWEKGRQAVLDMLEAQGMAPEEAAAWADAQVGSAADVTTSLEAVYQAWLDLPENKQTKYDVEMAEAAQKLVDLKALLDGIPDHTFKKVTLDSYQVDHFVVSNPDANANGAIYSGGVKSFAAGGVEPGIYPYSPGGIHKFAEEYDEAYMSMDPRRKARSYDVWVEAGNRFGFQQPQSSGDQRPINLSQTINTQPGMSESQVARKAADGINKALRG